MSSFFKSLRDWYEDFGTLQSVLKSLGLWQIISPLLLAGGVFIWSYLQHLPGPVAFVLALTALTCVLVLVVHLPEVLRRKVRVRLTPAKGPAAVQLLEAENLGPPQTFRAQCKLLDRRNDPNLLHCSTFRMEWDRPQKRAVKLRRGGSCNLIVAKAGVEHEMNWIEVWGLSGEGEGDHGEGKQRSMWNHGDRLPEYDLEISIIGENQKPHVECFTLRAGQTSALEMFAITHPA